MFTTKVKPNTNTEINLSKYKLWKIEGDRRGDVIHCLSGKLWITQEGDMKDYILEPGGNFWVTKAGTVVLQALDNAQFKYNLNELESRIENNTQPIRNSRLSRISHHLR
jgi:hypothetical protein